MVLCLFIATTPTNKRQYADRQQGRVMRGSCLMHIWFGRQWLLSQDPAHIILRLRTNNMPEMKTAKRSGSIRCRKSDAVPLYHTCRMCFTAGEVYLFNATDRRCPADGSLWGIFDKKIGQDIYLESSTFDLFCFRYWHRLPRKYRYCRLSTRDELRDYTLAEICERFAARYGETARQGV